MVQGEFRLAGRLVLSDGRCRRAAVALCSGVRGHQGEEAVMQVPERRVHINVNGCS